MVSNSFSFIGRAVAPMAVVLAIGGAAPAHAASLPVFEQMRTVVHTQTDVTQAAWRGHRHDGYRHYGYRYHRGGYDGLDVFGAVVGGALLYDDRYDNRYYDRYDDRYYQRRYYHHSRRDWAPAGWPHG